MNNPKVNIRDHGKKHVSEIPIEDKLSTDTQQDTVRNNMTQSITLPPPHVIDCDELGFPDGGLMSYVNNGGLLSMYVEMSHGQIKLPGVGFTQWQFENFMGSEEAFDFWVYDWAKVRAAEHSEANRYSKDVNYVILLMASDGDIVSQILIYAPSPDGRLFPPYIFDGVTDKECEFDTPEYWNVFTELAPLLFILKALGDSGANFFYDARKGAQPNTLKLSSLGQKYLHDLSTVPRDIVFDALVDQVIIKN